MSRPRFVPPTVDPRSMQNQFTQPPPNYNSTPVSSESEYKLPQNIPSLLTLNVFPHNQKKSYCSICEMWNTEPYDSHINSENHILNKTKERYDTCDNNDRSSPNISSNNSTNNLPNQPVPRYNGQSYDNTYIPPMYFPKRPLKRNFNPNEQVRPIKFNEKINAAESQNLNNSKTKRLKSNVIQQNNLNNNSHVADSQNFNNTYQNNYDGASIEIKAPVTANIGREMLIPISGVFCTLCEEFFRNTNSDETTHCESAKHLAAYEKLHGQFKELSDTKPLHECNDNLPPSKRSKDSSSSSKSSGAHSYSSIIQDGTTKADNSNIVNVASTHDIMESDQNSYSEFQGTDFSLDFPEETEDYDE